MFDFLQPNKEEKFLKEQTKNAQDFERERDNFKSTTQDDNTYFEHQQQRTDLIRWQQELDDELEKLKHRLKSEVFKGDEWVPLTFKEWDVEKQTSVIKSIPPLANDLFIEYLEAQIIPFLSRSLTNSNLDEKRILNLLKNTCDDIVDNMADHYDLYGIQFGNFDIILRMVKNVIIPAAFKSLGGWTKKIDSSMIKRVEAFQEHQQAQEQKKGILGVFSQ